MKKLLLLVVLLTISLTLTYGQAAVGGWGRGIFVPVIAADGELTSGSLVSWGPGGTRVGFTISGSSDNVGAQADILMDNGSVSVGDQQKIWVKPIEMLTLTVGSFFDDTLRGSASFCAYNWFRYDSMVGDGLIFYRVGELGQVNFEVSVAPMDGVTIFAAMGGNGGIDLQNWMWGTPPETPMMDMIMQGQYGAGYDIAGIGLVRAQFIGQPSATDDANGLINAAFKLTMVEGLLLDIGAILPIDSEQDGRTAAIALYANYVMNTLTLHLSGDFTLYDAEDADPGIGAALGVEYGLENGPTIQGDFRYRNNVASGWEDGEIGVMAGAKFSYSNGIFGIGVQLTNGNFANWGSALIYKEDPTAMVFAIPIRLEYWF
jgi:hypothetical protein